MLAFEPADARYNPEPFASGRKMDKTVDVTALSLDELVPRLLGRSTVCLSSTLLGGDKPLDMELRPLMALRPIHDLMYQWQGRLTVENGPGRTSEVEAEQAYGHSHRIPPTGRTPEVFFAHDGIFEGALDPQPTWYFNTIYRREQERGYRGLEDLWMPGTVKFKLEPGKTVYFACSTDPIDLGDLIGQVEARQRPIDALSVSCAAGAGAGGARVAASSDAIYTSLSRAAGQFVAAVPREGADGATGVAVVSQYPWSAPSGRDALIAFGGLFCATRRYTEGK